MYLVIFMKMYLWGLWNFVWHEPLYFGGTIKEEVLQNMVVWFAVVVLNHFRKHKNIFTFCIISQHWHATDCPDLSSQITKELFVPWLMMTWWPKDPGRQPPWYWPRYSRIILFQHGMVNIYCLLLQVLTSVSMLSEDAHDFIALVEGYHRLVVGTDDGLLRLESDGTDGITTAGGRTLVLFFISLASGTCCNFECAIF